MEFILNNYNRNISDEDLINDVKRLSVKLNKRYISRKEYVNNGKYSLEPFKRFGSWYNVLKLAELETARNSNDYYRINENELIDDVIKVANKLSKKSLTTGEYKDNGKYRIQTLLARFDTWENVLSKSKLDPTGNRRNIKDIDVINEMERIWILLGRQPTTTDIRNGISIYSLNTYARHFGSWRASLKKFVEYINVEENENDIINNPVIIKEKTDSVREKKVLKKHNANRDVNLRLRFKVFQRDNFKCCICGKSPAFDNNVILHVDHIIPWSRGGETVLENLQTLCSNCNLGKSDL
jgi:5-methylcytosine-specific restriction endonuclease McrA